MKKYDNSPNDNQLDNLRSDINLIESEIYSAKTIIEINKSAVDSLETEEREINTKLQKNLNDLNVSIQSIDDLNIRNSQICVKLEELKDVKKSIEENKQTLSKFKASYEIYISNLNEAMSLEELLQKNQEHILLKTQLEEKLKELKESYLSFDIKNLKDIEAKKDLAVNELSANISALKTAISINEERKEVLEKELFKIKEYEERKEELKKESNKYQKLIEKLKLYRNIYNNLPRELSKQLRKYISSYASNLYRKISSENVVIEIMDDYEVVLIDCVDNSKMKHLSQLSGGEQMSVAISIRLAMLKQIANVEFYFMDEPTINLDYERRMMVAEVVKDMSNELRQLFVISHDDTFESITDNTIKIEKYNNTSKLC
jgi:exonuclease SbcC